MNPKSSGTAIIVRNLTYQYAPGGPYILDNLNFRIISGESVAITGLSGCGKSTLCLCLSGAIRQHKEGLQSGEIIINNQRLEALRTAETALEVGIVFQDPDAQLFSPTVEDEIAFAPENLCLPPYRIRQQVDQVLELLGIKHLRESNPYLLSGGEKHLVALASVLALDPPILILDEVMSQLDAPGKERVVAAMGKLHKLGKTIIVIEHNLEAVGFADRMMVLEHGQITRFDRTETIMSDHIFLRDKRLIF